MELYSTLSGLNEMVETLQSILNGIDGYIKILIAATVFNAFMLFVVMILVSVINAKMKSMEEDLFYIRQDLKLKR